MGSSGAADSASNFRPRLDNNWWGVSAQGKFDFGDYTLTSITAYDDFTHGRLVDYDAVPTVQQHVDYNSEIEAWSQELRLGYDAAGDLSWLIGASYAEDTLMEGTLLTGQTGLVPLAFGGLTEAFQPYTQETKAIVAGACGLEILRSVQPHPRGALYERGEIVRRRRLSPANRRAADLCERQQDL
ncbi:MAG: hypothetical protein R3C54_14925 [Parvularculaceae bacterium]